MPRLPNATRTGWTFSFFLAVLLGLGLGSLERLHNSVLEGVAHQDMRASHSGENPAVRPGVCEREAERIAGQKPVKISRSVRGPKRLRHVAPKYPELPRGTRASGVWVGEAVINNSGKIAQVWPSREVQIVPPFPAFNTAITEAIRQWEFEPLRIVGKPTPVCMTVTVNIN
jgi:TonB family protein